MLSAESYTHALLRVQIFFGRPSALALAPEARLRLARALVRSLESIAPEIVRGLWIDEAERRDAENFQLWPAPSARSDRDQLHMTSERDDERFDVLGIGRDEVVSILRQQGDSRINHVSPLRDG